MKWDHVRNDIGSVVGGGVVVVGSVVGSVVVVVEGRWVHLKASSQCHHIHIRSQCGGWRW